MALAVCALVAVTCIEFELPISFEVLGYIFFGSITGYNFVKYAPAAGLHHRSLAPHLKAIQLFSFLCFGIVGYFVFQMPAKVLYLSCIFGILTFLYAIPFLKKKNLRTLSGLKIFVVAVVWAGMTVLIPYVYTKTYLSLEVWWSFVQRGLIVIVLTLPFEIRDLRYDLIGLRTIPQQIGIRNTKVLGIVLLVVALALEFAKAPLNEIHLMSLGLMVVITAAALKASGKRQSLYYASFWVESLPIGWWAGLITLKALFG